MRLPTDPRRCGGCGNIPIFVVQETHELRHRAGERAEAAGEGCVRGGARAVHSLPHGERDCQGAPGRDAHAHQPVHLEDGIAGAAHAGARDARRPRERCAANRGGAGGAGAGVVCRVRGGDQGPAAQGGAGCGTAVPAGGDHGADADGRRASHCQEHRPRVRDPDIGNSDRGAGLPGQVTRRATRPSAHPPGDGAVQPAGQAHAREAPQGDGGGGGCHGRWHQRCSCSQGG
mmetsp:Transcript_27257/g.64985  ORF Transcript_27257/g.64985 Transcript_27257/m.64985 type:complete len:231 (+) Transcript_27257:1749-2441(+)